MQLCARFYCVLIAFVCSLLAPAAAVAQQDATAVSLDTPQVWRLGKNLFPDGKGRWGSPLSMEFARQAVLIAARDELGLRTMDASLGEPASGPGVLALTMELDMILRTGSQIGLLHGEQQVMDHFLETDWFVHPDQANTIVRHELLSRNEAVDALKKAGLDGEPNAWVDDAAVPESITELLDEMSLVSQFRAARALHQLIREEGESPQRLWALSRAYANLGQESRWFIRCEFAVFQARSLLYAQRLRAKSPDHPLGHLSLAYAWTMSTYTRDALAELNQFDMAGEAGEPWRDWAALLRACCMYDKFALDEIALAGGPRAAIAATWGVVTNEFIGLKGLTFKSIDDAMKINPLSTRNLYSGYDAMGVSAGHWLTEAAPKHFSIVTTMQLARIDQAPQAVDALLPAEGAEAMSLRQLAETAWAMQDLTAAGKDPNELSFAVLGTLIDEANALHILYRAKFMRRQWGVDTTGYLRETIPALQRHPFRPLIVSFVFPSNVKNEAIEQLVAAYEPGYINHVNLSAFTLHLHNDLTFADGMSEIDWWRLAISMNYMSGTDWLVRMRWYYGDSIHMRGKHAGTMWTYDTHHPKRIALRIQYSKLSEEKVNQLVQQYGNHAIVADALAARMEAGGDIAKARDYAELAAMAAPERKTVERQARLELLLGSEDKWLELMKLVLELPDNGLDHAKINQIVAHTLMNQGRYEEALPYAKASADSWAAWAMSTYLVNLSVLGKHDEARAIGRRINERYGANYLAEENVQIWSGTADTGRMIKSFEQSYRLRYGNDPEELTWRLLYIEMAMGRYEASLKRVEASLERGMPNMRVLMFGVLAAQQLGRDETRDKLLGLLINYELEDGKRQRLSLLADHMKQATETGKIDWDFLAQWTEQHNKNGIEVPMNIGLFALTMPNERERAAALLLTLAKLPTTNSNINNIARSALRSAGYTNEQMKPVGFSGHELPERDGLD